MISTICSSRRCRRRARDGFTLAELFVTIGFAGTLISIIVPSVTSARLAQRQLEVRERVRTLCLFAIELREGRHGPLPFTTAELAAYVQRQEPSYFPKPFRWEEGDTEIIDATHDYCYVVESSDREGFILCAHPKAPYSSGSDVICFDENREIVSRPPDDEAVAEEKLRDKQARFRALEGVGKLILLADNPADASFVLPYLQSLDPQTLSSQVFDANDDRKISLTEVRAVAQPQINDTPAVAEMREILQDVLEIYYLDRDEPESEPVVVSLADLKGDPTELFSADSIGVVIDTYFAKEGVAQSQKKLLRAAEIARLAGNVTTNVAILRAMSNERLAQIGKSISEEDAAILESLSRVLVPAERFNP